MYFGHACRETGYPGVSASRMEGLSQDLVASARFPEGGPGWSHRPSCLSGWTNPPCLGGHMLRDPSSVANPEASFSDWWWVNLWGHISMAQFGLSEVGSWARTLLRRHLGILGQKPDLVVTRPWVPHEGPHASILVLQAIPCFSSVSFWALRLSSQSAHVWCLGRNPGDGVQDTIIHFVSTRPHLCLYYQKIGWIPTGAESQPREMTTSG